MGGLFSAPKPPPPPPAPDPIDPEAEDRKRRLEMIERRRRGRSGLVTTSNRGLLTEAVNTASTTQATPKAKLGE